MEGTNVKPRPFYKSPLFWTFSPLVLALILVVDLVQVGVGTTWLKRRAMARQPATRALAAQQSMPQSAMRFIEAPAYKAKPGEWQVPQPDASVLDSAPPQATVLPTKFGPNSEYGRAGWAMRREDKAIGIGMPVRSIIATAYKWQGRTVRIIFADQLPTGQYDYIANLPSGAYEAFQEEIKKKLGLVAQPETRMMECYVLKLKNTDAPGLKPSAGRVAGQSEPGMIRYTYAPMSNLITSLEAMLGKPVVDQTGLTGNFDIRYPALNRPGSGATAEFTEQARKTILEHLGLDLISTNGPVEVLVVKKINP